MTHKGQPVSATIHHGDCIEVMQTMPENSIDAIVTDPPYNLSNGSKRDAQCFREIVTEVLLPHDNNRNSQRGEGRDLAVPSLSGAGLGGERRPVRVDAGVGVPEGPVDLQGASIAEHEVHAGDEATSSAPDGDLPGVGDSELVKHHGDFILQLADGGNAPFCDGTCSCFTEPSTGVIGVAVVVPPLAGSDSASLGLVVVGGNPDVGPVNDAGGQAEGAPLVHAGGGTVRHGMLRLDLRGGTGELDFTHGALEGLPLFELVSAESVTAGAGASRLSPVAKPHRVRLVRDGADGALTVHMVGHGSKSTTGFMGKVWDGWESPAAFQRWNREWVAACYRVLKPGGHILAFGGSRTWHRLAVAIEDGGFEMRDSIAWLYGSGFPKHRAALKPAFEPIVMGRKPFKGSLTTNEATHGTGALNIEASRIRLQDDEDAGKPTARSGGVRGWADSFVGGKAKGAEPTDMSKGRWPANVILDESTAAELDQQSGVLTSGGGDRGQTGNFGTGESIACGRRKKYERKPDSGGASRFFYVAKAPKKERPNVDGTIHPTVKPLTLMRHLIRLVTPEGGTILDTFAGSGTTLEAATLEGYKSIGIENEAEYLPLIQHRLERTKIN